MNDARTEGTSDRSIIFTTPYNDVAHVTGTLPAKNLTISGATPNPPKQLAIEIVSELKKHNIAFNGKIIINSERLIEGQNPLAFPKNKVILEYLSPTLDKMVFWFLKKSINFYGETFVKTMAKEKTGNSSFESGMKYLKNFWKQRGIDERMINFVDGSGLSPQNYASTRAEVLALIWAKTSDRSVIFTTPYNNVAHITGTLPAKNITISGATPNPPKQLALEIVAELKKQNIAFNGKIIINSERLIEGQNPLAFPKNKVILEYLSPTLDKMVFWFLKKRINFYVETFVKTMAKEKTGNSSFESGMKFLKNFWKQRGIDERMINFVDGSGLSPQNYAATRAEVLALIWAKKQSWFAEYFEGFPVQGNGMKMKR